VARLKSKPIVENPKQAIEDFLKTKMDYLVLGNFVISKTRSDLVFPRLRGFTKSNVVLPSCYDRDKMVKDFVLKEKDK
jgi:hypothetical protein